MVNHAVCPTCGFVAREDNPEEFAALSRSGHCIACEFDAHVAARIEKMRGQKAQRRSDMVDWTALLIEWREAQHSLAAASVEWRKNITRLQREAAELERPYRERMQEIEAELLPSAVAAAKTVKHEESGVKVAFRKGATRVTYDWRTVDSIAAFLRDVLPATSEALTDARSQSTGDPSVKFSVYAEVQSD